MINIDRTDFEISGEWDKFILYGGGVGLWYMSQISKKTISYERMISISKQPI